MQDVPCDVPFYSLNEVSNAPPETVFGVRFSWEYMEDWVASHPHADFYVTFRGAVTASEKPL